MKLFSLRAQVSLPFEHFVPLGSLHGKLFAHKAWELEHNFYSGSLFDIDTKWTLNEDHAGIEIGIGIFGYGISFRIYDTRHWDYELKQWVIYD
jgi:hypothetical protein